VRFLADMGVDVRVVDWLRRHGHDAVHLRERGMHRALDAEVFQTALAEDRISSRSTSTSATWQPSHVTAAPASFFSGWRTRAPRMSLRALTRS
jgi:uncharacterized protein DUF5615